MKIVLFIHSNSHICFYTYANTITGFIFSSISNFNLRLYVDFYLSNQSFNLSMRHFNDTIFINVYIVTFPYNLY